MKWFVVIVTMLTLTSPSIPTLANNKVVVIPLFGTTSVGLVSIAVTPPNPSVVTGLTLQFLATGFNADGSIMDLSTDVIWSSSDPSVATVSNTGGSKGVTTGLNVGTTQISGSFDGITGNTTLTVTAVELVSISVTPPYPLVVAGLDQQFTATGHYTDGSSVDFTADAVWVSSDHSVAIVSNIAGSEGLATGLNVGTTQISGSFDGITGDTTLTVTAAELVFIAVTPPNPSVVAGFTQQFAATGYYTDGSSIDLTTDVVWVSGDPGVASVSNTGGSEGLATAVNTGITQITANSGLTGIHDYTSLTVTAP